MIAVGLYRSLVLALAEITPVLPKSPDTEPSITPRVAGAVGEPGNADCGTTPAPVTAVMTVRIQNLVEAGINMPGVVSETNCPPSVTVPVVAAPQVTCVNVPDGYSI